jgi:hypothetical protein
MMIYNRRTLFQVRAFSFCSFPGRLRDEDGAGREHFMLLSQWVDGFFSMSDVVDKCTLESRAQIILDRIAKSYMQLYAAGHFVGPSVSPDDSFFPMPGVNKLLSKPQGRNRKRQNKSVCRARLLCELPAG